MPFIFWAPKAKLMSYGPPQLPNPKSNAFKFDFEHILSTTEAVLRRENSTPEAVFKKVSTPEAVLARKLHPRGGLRAPSY